MTQAFNLSQFANNLNSGGQISLTSAVTGILPVANGGTGTNTSTFCNLTSNVSGILPVANGGTGTTSYANLLTSLGIDKNQLVKAWVYFYGSSGAIINSYNMSSVTRNSTGEYTFTMTNALSNANYVCAGTMQYATGATLQGYFVLETNYLTPTTTQVRLGASVGGSYYDPQVAGLLIIGNQ